MTPWRWVSGCLVVIDDVFAAQLAPPRGLLPGGFFTRRLQQASGANAQSIDMVMILVKTQTFRYIANSRVTEYYLRYL